MHLAMGGELPTKQQLESLIRVNDRMLIDILEHPSDLKVKLRESIRIAQTQLLIGAYKP